MDMELEALAAKIEQVVALVHQLRAENEALRSEIAAADAERQQLRQNMTAARERLEILLEKLPEEA
jgi:cell division protein ZapB